MFASTLTGWALAGTFRTPLNKDAFGLTVPLIYASQDRAMHGLFEESHKILSYALAALVVVHIVGGAAASFHQAQQSCCGACGSAKARDMTQAP